MKNEYKMSTVQFLPNIVNLISIKDNFITFNYIVNIDIKYNFVIKLIILKI